MDDLRSDARIGTFLRGTISTSDGAAKIACLVKDLSDSGAKIEVDPDCPLAPSFDLEITKLGATFKGEMRWRYAHLVGVKFKGEKRQPTELRPTRDELLAENRYLKETVQALAARLTQLGEHLMLPPAPPAVDPSEAGRKLRVDLAM